MSVNTLPSDPTIELTFKGLIISNIHDGAKYAEIGALTVSECHAPKISVLKTLPGQEPVQLNLNFDLSKDLCLRTCCAPQKEIQVFQKGEFDRSKDTNDPHDFRWLVNLETDLIPGEQELKVDRGKILPVFRVENAVFFTRALTKGKVSIKNGSHEKEFGLTANHIGATIQLDSDEGEVLLMNGYDVLLRINKAEGAQYNINFNCECVTNQNQIDFPLIYQVLDVPEEKRVTFTGEIVELAGESNTVVYCFGTNSASALRPPAKP